MMTFGARSRLEHTAGAQKGAAMMPCHDDGAFGVVAKKVDAHFMSGSRYMALNFYLRTIARRTTTTTTHDQFGQKVERECILESDETTTRRRAARILMTSPI